MMTQRTGSFDLVLHPGVAPRWLLNRMKKLSEGILQVMIGDYGTSGVLERISNPAWFQSLAHILAFDWNSSGATTVTCSVLKQAAERVDMGLKVAGGKGRRAKLTPLEIRGASDSFGFSTAKTEELIYASRLAAKVDNALLQDGHRLYHHVVFMDKDGRWAVVQQGLNVGTRTARRYHWLSMGVKSFVEEPHSGLYGKPLTQLVLDMTAKVSRECREVSVELARSSPKHLKRRFDSLRPRGQKTLIDFLPASHLSSWDAALPMEYSYVDLDVNWKALEAAYQLQPTNYEQLAGLQGIGPATIRSLALLAQLIHGAEPSWRDPLRYTFAFGGKDGVPYPVDRRTMDEAIAYLQEALEAVEVERRTKLEVIKSLARFQP